MNFKLYLSNCSVTETPPTTVANNEEISFTVSVNSGSILNTTYDLGLSNARYIGQSQRINSTTAILQFIIDSDDPSDNSLTAIIALNAQSSLQYDEFMIIQNGTFQNCTTNIDDGGIIYEGLTFEITANNNYNFLNSLYNIGAVDYPLSTYDKIKLNINAESNKLYIEAATISNSETVLWAYDEYIATGAISVFDGFVNIFTVTKEELTNLSRTMVINLSNGQPYTYMQFILDIYSLPFSIENLKGQIDSVILGNFDTGINCTRLNDEILIINLGTISVPAQYNNIYDYINVTINYYAPFFGAIEIDADFVINQSISANLEINLYNGDCVLNLNSTYINEIFYSSTANIGKHIPLLDRANNALINNLTMQPSQYLYNHSFITVARNIPYDIVTDFGHGVKQYTELKNVAGYNVINNINLVSNATESEKNEIISLLQEGVFINDTA